MGSGKWTWMVLVATGALAWACGGDDDSHGSNDSDTSSSTSGNGGTAGDGGIGGTGPNTTGNGTGGDAGATTTATATGGVGGTTTTGTDSGGTGGGAGDAGAAGMAGMAGAAGAPNELTGDDIRALCEADCAHLAGVGCPEFEEDYCVEVMCVPFYIPGCEAEYAAFLECDASKDASDPNEYVCLDEATPSTAYSCDALFGAVLACTP